MWTVDTSSDSKRRKLNYVLFAHLQRNHHYFNARRFCSEKSLFDLSYIGNKHNINKRSGIELRPRRAWSKRCLRAPIEKRLTKTCPRTKIEHASVRASVSTSSDWPVLLVPVMFTKLTLLLFLSLIKTKIEEKNEPSHSRSDKRMRNFDFFQKVSQSWQ